MSARSRDSDARLSGPAQAESGPAATLAALREAGAHRFDPVCFRYIEALATRTEQQPGAIRRVLERSLQDALANYLARRDSARQSMAQIGGSLARRFPDAGAEIEGLVAQTDERALQQLGARLEARADRGSLSELIRRLDRPSTDTSTRNPASTPGAPRELKALRESKASWTRLRIDRQLQQSQASIPANPGPLNSLLLVLRALQTMQEISPSYLQHFIAHLETLSWLDRAAVGNVVSPAKAAPADGGKKRGARRGKSR